MAAEAAALFIEQGDRLNRDHETLAARLTEPGGDLGRLRGDS